MPFDLSGVVQVFSAATVGAEAWSHALDVLARTTGGIGALAFSKSGRRQIGIMSESLVETTEAYLGGKWNLRDDRYKGVPSLTRTGAFGDQELYTQEEMARSPYYQEFLRPFGLQWSAVLGVPLSDDLCLVSIQRRIEAGPYTIEEIRALAGLGRHIASAFATAQALDFARAEGAVMAFEASNTAALVIDRSGGVRRANGAAERLMDADLAIVRGRLTSRDPEATRRLDRMLASMTEGSAAPALGTPVPLSREGRRPVVAYPLRLPGTGQEAFRGASLIVLVDLEPPLRGPDTVLRSLFGLTAAEAGLAAILAAGESLEEAAARLQITRETAKSHLRSIFGKTDTHRQGEFVALTTRLMVPRPDGA